MVYSWRLFLLVLCVVAFAEHILAFTGPNELRNIRVSPKVFSRRFQITASLDDLEKKLLSSLSNKKDTAPAPVRSVAKPKQSPSPKPVPAPKPSPAQKPVPAPKTFKAPVVKKTAPPSASAVSSSDFAAGVGLGIAPWVIAPVVALAAGRDALMKTKKAREIAQKKLEEERLAELAKVKAAEPVQFQLEGKQGTYFAAALAAVGVGIGGLLLQANVANVKPVEAPVSKVAPVAPKPKSVVEAVKEVKDTEKKIEKKIEAAEKKVEKAVKKDVENIEYTLEDSARTAEKNIEKTVVQAEKAVEQKIETVEKVLEKEVKAPAAAPKPQIVSTPEPPKSAPKVTAQVPKVEAPKVDASKAESINPELLKALKAGKYKTF